MRRYYNVTCDTCHTKINIIEEHETLLGGKELEEANCPVCGSVVHSSIINGYFKTQVDSIENTIEPYKTKWLNKPEH